MTNFNYAEESARVKQVLRKAFPDSFLTTSEGWRGRVHVKIVSEAFDGKGEMDKQTIVWDALRESLESDAQVVSLITVYGPDQL